MMSITACTLVACVVVLTVSTWSFAQTADNKADQQAAQITAAAVNKLREGDTFIAIQWIAGHDPRTAVDVFGRLQQHVYWTQKDIGLSTMLGRAGLQLGLSEAARLDSTDSAKAAELRAIAKGLAYDMGSFNWPGWDEPGITPSPTDIAAGYDGAKANLRLAIELKKPAVPMSKAHWLLGAYQLNAGDHPAATASFRQAAELAAAAGQKQDELLNIGYIQIVAQLESPADPRLKADYESLKKDLAKLEEGPFFVQQLDTVLKVYSGRK